MSATHQQYDRRSRREGDAGDENADGAAPLALIIHRVGWQLPGPAVVIFASLF
jgi:hypothetical protein